MFKCSWLPSLQVQITGEIRDPHNGTAETSNRVRRHAVSAADVTSQKTWSFWLKSFSIYSFENIRRGQICVVRQILFTNAVMGGANKKLTASQKMESFSAVHVTLRLITMFTSARQMSPIHYPMNPVHAIRSCFYKILFNIVFLKLLLRW